MATTASPEQNKVIYTMSGVTKAHDKKVVLKDIYLSYFYGAKIGVLGLNGSGKSSLLKILAGVDKQYDGQISLAPGYTIGYLEQEPQLTAGLAVVTTAVALEGNSVCRLSSRAYWYPYAPVIYLAHEASVVDPSRRDPALSELVRRSRAGALSASDTRRVADAALTYQADRSKPWDASWGELLERFRAAGRLSDDGWSRYAAQAVLTLTVQARSSVRSGDPLPFRCDLDLTRVASPTALWMAPQQKSRSCEVTPQSGGPAVPVNAHRSRVDASDLLQFRPDGSAWRLVYRTEVEVGDRKAGLRTPAVQRLVASAPFVMGPATRASVAPLPDPALAAAIRRSLAVTARWDGHPDRGLPAVDVDVDSERTPFDVSFDVLVRSAGSEIRVGDFCHGREPLGFHLTLRCPPSVDRARPVDVIFRSDPGPAAATTVDVSTIWAGELTFAGVSVD